MKHTKKTQIKTQIKQQQNHTKKPSKTIKNPNTKKHKKALDNLTPT